MDFKRSVSRNSIKLNHLPSYMQAQDASRMNVDTINSKALRENNYAKRDLKPQGEILSSKFTRKRPKRKLRYSERIMKNYGFDFSKADLDVDRILEGDEIGDDDEEDSISALFHDHNL